MKKILVCLLLAIGLSSSAQEETVAVYESTKFEVFENISDSAKVAYEGLCFISLIKRNDSSILRIQRMTPPILQSEIYVFQKTGEHSDPDGCVFSYYKGEELGVGILTGIGFRYNKGLKDIAITDFKSMILYTINPIIPKL